MSKWVVDIHGEIEGDYELIKKYEEPKAEWIPCGERLPISDEECHTFLVTDSKGNVIISEFYLSLMDRKPYWSGMIEVIAWMPLPEPYKPESKTKQALAYADQDTLMPAT